MQKRKLFLVSLLLSAALIGCSGEQNSDSSTMDTVSEDTVEETVSNTQTQTSSTAIKQSPDKYTYYVKDYTNMNLASIGYYSMGGELLDEYGAGRLKINYVTPQGTYIDLENKDDLKNYVVVAQSIAPNTEIKYEFQKDSDGNEYDNLVGFQSIEEIDLAVIGVGSNDSAAQLVEIKPSEDKYNMYIRNYVGKNLASIGYYSMGGDILDSYGDGTLELVFITDDGSYIDPEDRETQKAYVVVGQNIEPNTPISFTYAKDSDGKEYDNLVDSQSYETINVNVTKVENADEILNAAISKKDAADDETAETKKTEEVKEETKEETKEEASTKTETDNTDKSSSSTDLVDGMRPEFKQAMDSYEAFYNEYCEILKKYNANPTDTSIMSDYMKLLEKQDQVDKDFEKWNGDMNDAEMKYYLEVNNRVIKKLTETN